MPLILEPMQESDMEASVDIMWEAFRDSIMGIMYPQGFTKAAREHTLQTSLKAWRKDPEKYRKNKVIDTDLPDDDRYNKIVGTAWWKFYPKPRTDAEIEKEDEESKQDGLPPDIDVSMIEGFGAALQHAKKVHVAGKPHIVLHILTTHPNHHRRGVGAMHLEWGFEQANKLGLPVWLEASPIGRPLYARMGFDTVGWLPFDFTRFKNGKDLPHALMLRQPERTKGVNSSVEDSITVA
ncbi:hypothetical protein BAUCODRAFT_152467 [Baudoinia panamericana UAMH 10762]|uniref:N-acetyltransferase domain-containing protein n=1 Tax=Baudoinia panamericana (strain UAMH 10762) TaxID=717646 RepID=M2MY27_BAUPA|nr:uncharacterized protein BAUCODRAFT_152467 [Baudoinia panamericana UAMH 10762]EMC91180.1 hypothetical protein BAUCODRAFT_152467 [Baudoinia panamericana UAMH 10762]